jgi:hypothetical protein
MSEASRRPPQHFLELNEKGGEKYQLKLEDLALLCSVLFYLEKLDCLVYQIGLSGFARQNFYISFHFLITVDLRTCCIA